MAEYFKNKVDNKISVKSIATVFRKDLSNRISRDDVHDFPEIFYMAEKEGSTIVAGKRFDLKAGQMIIYAPNVLHGGGSGGMAEIISFETENPLPDFLCNRVITLTGNQRVMFRRIISKASTLFEPRIGINGMALKPHADAYALQSVKNLLELFLLDMLSPSETYEESRINIVTDYMTKNIGRVLTLQQISQDLGLSIPTLKRLVQQSCNLSPIAYFNELKIIEAKRLIKESPMNMTEIAEKLGFYSVHHFSKAFKLKTGVTPTEYEKESTRG